jgi:exosortase
MSMIDSMIVHTKVKNAGFAVFVGLTLAIFWTPLSLLIRFSFQHEHYSHIVLVPIITIALVLLERRKIFSQVATGWWGGSSLLGAGAFLYVFAPGLTASASPNDQLSGAMFSIVVMWIGAFTLCYGTHALRRGLFPLLFLVLMVPIPDALLNQAITWLLRGSAEISYALLELLGVPFVRTGFIFAFPGFAIEIADECSGIRSSLALLVMSLLVGHLSLRSAWAKTVLVVTTLPILVVKNGIRIVTLSLLSVYIDPSFLTGRLHHQGGVVFFLIALMLLAPVLRILQKLESTRGTSAAKPDRYTATPPVEVRE